MRKTYRLIMGAAFATVFAAAHAGNDTVQFLNIDISGSLARGATATTSRNMVDFSFPNAIVGDGEDRRSGNIVITYEARSASPLVMNKMFIGILGALAGNGKIFFNEVVEDLEVPGFIGTHNAMLDRNSQLPYVTVMNFSRASNHIKVKKTFTLSAVDGPGLDLAQLSLNEQNIGVVPEPASMAVLATGAVALMRRRRKAA